MNKHIYIVLLIAFFTGMGPAPFSPKAEAQVSVSFQVFYDELSPYGSWVSYPEYGYVWVPRAVRHGFRPYGSGGYWVYTEDGWAWVSNYNWGWAPFHYGNWFYDDSYGWMWAPGYEWAPAWVTWGEYEHNYCWAPIGPGINISIGGGYRAPAYYWNFVPREHITSVNINNYYVTNVNRTTIVNNITVINNVNSRGSGPGHAAYVRGPEPQSVQKYTHTPIRPLTIRETSRPGGGNVQSGQLALYRPSVSRNSSNNARPAPAHVQDLHALRPGSLPANAHVQVNTPSNNNAQTRLQPNRSQDRPQPSPSNRRPQDQVTARPNNSRQPSVQRQSPQPGQQQAPLNRSQDQVTARPNNFHQQPQQQQRPQQRQQPAPLNRSQDQVTARPNNFHQQPQQQQRPQPRQQQAPMNRPVPDQGNARPANFRQQPVQESRPQQRQPQAQVNRASPGPPFDRNTAPRPPQKEDRRP